MKLSLRTSLVILLLSLAISTIFATFNYNYQLEHVTIQNQELVKQLSDNAKTTSAIAAYLVDTELGSEVVEGLANNDLIMSATIRMVTDNLVVSAGTPSNAIASINTQLNSPFIPDEVIGTLEVVPNVNFIESQASSTSLQNAFLLVGLSFIIAIIVGLYVNAKLTTPIKHLSDAVMGIDTGAPEDILPIDIGYARKDEISNLSKRTNDLIAALKQQFLSERHLRESTEELQRRFRLLFEQSTAGIGLLSAEGTITIGNPAFHKLFGRDVNSEEFSSLFESPIIIKDQIKLLSQDDEISQTDLDIELNLEGDRRYIHCIFSSISDAREEMRHTSDQLVEVIIYDITHRKQREQKARYEADHDSLTGLLSRRAGLEQLTQKLAHQQKDSSVFVLMMIDLDKFKPVNDTHGHDVGDIVLRHVSQRIMACGTDANAVNIRWGGDEFLLGMSFNFDDFSDDATLIDSAHIKSQVEQLIDAISEPVKINEDLSVQVGASVGVVLLAPQQQAEIDNLITRADELMYITKRQTDKRYSIVSVQS